MDIPWGDEKTTKFVSHIGLISTDGPHGPDIMACEWTQQISYRPALLAVYVKPTSATYDNLLASGCFGVSIASEGQSVLTSVAGGQSGKTVHKIKVLDQLGFRFRAAEQIAVLLPEGTSFWAECTLADHRPYGDHEMFVGEIVCAAINKEAKPLLYHGGTYWRKGEQILKPPAEELEKIREIIQKAKK